MVLALLGRVTMTLNLKYKLLSLYFIKKARHMVSPSPTQLHFFLFWSNYALTFFTFYTKHAPNFYTEIALGFLKNKDSEMPWPVNILLKALFVLIFFFFWVKWQLQILTYKVRLTKHKKTSPRFILVYFWKKNDRNRMMPLNIRE